MFQPTLACGPYIDPADPSFWVPVATYLLLKPLAYFAFIQAFRYRVSRAIPMSFRRAAGLALLRAGLGVAFFAAGAAIVIAARSDAVLVASWAWLYAERLASWFIVGRFGAGIRGRRLAGWVIGGTLLNAAFDAGVIAGLFEAWPWVAAIAAGLAALIVPLHVIGRRAALRARYAAACPRCGYDLTGNLSGSCPECGAPVLAAAA
jgi:hypothetical protein